LLRSLVVDPRARTTGIGSQLVAHAEAYARARGMPSIYLLTTTAEAFFAARGYAHRPSGRTTEHSVHARVFRLMPGKLRIHGQASTGVTEMKRLHVHVAVENLEASIRFYSHLFSTEPTIRKDDYAKWMLDDPRVNFAISARGATAGVEHLGIQVENRVELADVYSRLQRADGPVLEEGVTTCCYAKSEKSWIEDPQGVKWETFLTTGESTTYGSDTVKAPPSTCCPSKAA
jgi:hypothetical protein